MPNHGIQCAVWEWTYPAADETVEDFKVKIGQIFKKWSFQKEVGDGGYIHFQGRGSLFKKRRFDEFKTLCNQVGLEKMHISETVTSNILGEAFYCMKVDTRIDGPWRDDDPEPVYVPRQFRGLEDRWYPLQTQIIDSAQDFDARIINLLWDPRGHSGKTCAAVYTCLYHGGLRLPCVNDAEKLTASVCDILMKKQTRQPGPMFFDLPRSMDKSHMRGIFTAIEEIKNGHVYDLRYKFKEYWFDSPVIWVFTNTKPDLSALSMDRWKIWTVDHDEKSLDRWGF